MTHSKEFGESSDDEPGKTPVEIFAPGGAKSAQLCAKQRSLLNERAQEQSAAVEESAVIERLLKETSTRLGLHPRSEAHHAVSLLLRAGGFTAMYNTKMRFNAEVVGYLTVGKYVLGPAGDETAIVRIG